MKKTYAILGYNGIPTEKYREALTELRFTDVGDQRSQSDGSRARVVANKRSIGLLLVFKDKLINDRTTRSYCRTAVDNVDNICNKGRLRKTLGEVGEKYMAREFRWSELAHMRHMDLETVVLAKPISGFGGKGIEIYKKGDYIDLITPASYVFCEYVTDLMLFRERKFHLRAYLFVTTWGTFRVYPEYRIITAKLPYVTDDWKNKDIHDTHLQSTDADYFFRPGGDLYLEKTDLQIQEICQEIIRHLQPRPYSESKVGYEMLGLDYLVKSNGDVVLVEVNTNAGIKCVEEWNTYKAGVLRMEMEIVRELLSR